MRTPEDNDDENVDEDELEGDEEDGGRKGLDLPSWTDGRFLSADSPSLPWKDEILLALTVSNSLRPLLERGSTSGPVHQTIKFWSVGFVC